MIAFPKKNAGSIGSDMDQMQTLPLDIDTIAEKFDDLKLEHDKAVDQAKETIGVPSTAMGSQPNPLPDGAGKKRVADPVPAPAPSQEAAPVASPPAKLPKFNTEIDMGGESKVESAKSEGPSVPDLLRMEAWESKQN